MIADFSNPDFCRDHVFALWCRDKAEGGLKSLPAHDVGIAMAVSEIAGHLIVDAIRVARETQEPDSAGKAQ